MGVNGILNVNKPAGRTSFSVVSIIRRLTAEKRVGHAGTLDPAATGVLPVCIGQATRIVEYLHDCPKVYVAAIELGTTTDTFDREGIITGKKDAGSITSQQIEQALACFQGTIEQVPPAYSAVKINGRQSYTLARQGVPVYHQPRKVTIDSIEILGYDNPLLRIRIRCSKGTYIRSLASDLGKSLGCGAYLNDLTRTAYGPFGLPEAASIAEIRDAAAASSLDRLIFPLDYPLQKMQSRTVAEELALEVIQGHDIDLTDRELSENSPLCAYSASGKFLAILKFVPETRLWHPEKVFNL